MRHTVSRTAGPGAVAGYLTLQWLGRTWGATRQERHRPLPGDRLTRHPVAVTTHAITVHTPPAHIWPWLVQMGWHRAGWYTAEWVDPDPLPRERSERRSHHRRAARPQAW